MHARSNSTRGGRGTGHSYSNSVGQKAQLSLAYQELVKELSTTHVKTVGNYVLGRAIGEGSFGKVKLAVHKLTSQRCAVKQIPRSQAATLLTREIHHHRRLHHPNVVQLYEIIATEQSVWLISELCAGGELFDYLVEKGRIGEWEARRLFGQLCLGVGYIHSQGVVHRDLKLENVLLDERCNIKIADFGFGREFEQRRLLETFCGTTGYAAPEMLAGKKYSGEEVDIWSLGVILYTLLTGSLPFDDDDEDVIKAKILKCDYDLPLWLSEDARSLLSAVLQLDPTKRPKIRQILAYDWFTRSTHGTPTMPFATSALTPSQSRDRVPYLDSIAAGRADTAVTPGRTQYEQASHESGLGISGVASQQTTSDSAQKPGDAATRPSTDTSSSATTSQSLQTSTTSAALSDSLARLSVNVTNGSSQRLPLASPTLAELGSTSPAFPIPVHSRTPSRTKRRSIGSTMSERTATAIDALPDFLGLLSDSSSDGVSTAMDRHLLDQLNLLGFDTGQIVHSVKTHACDTSSALWWIMKAKADQKEVEARELDFLHGSSMTPARSGSMSSLAPSIATIATVAQTPASGRISPLPGDRTLRADPNKSLQPVVESSDTLDARAASSQADDVDRTRSNVEYGSSAATHSPRQRRTLSTTAVRLSSTSAPLLVASPAITSGSTRPKTAEELKSYVKDRPLSASASSHASAHTPPAAGTDVSPSAKTPTKARSASVSAVSMLARAQSVLSSSRAGKDTNLQPAEASRPTTLTASTAWFTRRPSGSNVQVVDKPTLLSRKSRELFQHITPLPSPGNADIGHPAVQLTDSQPNPSIVLSDVSHADDGSSPIRKRQSKIPHDSPSGHSTTSVASQTSDTSTAVLSVGSSGSGSSQHVGQGDVNTKKPQRLSRNLFTSFRTWFNDDRRRSRKLRDPGANLGLQRSVSSQSAGRRPVLHGPSPLKRPPIARLPSNGPTAVPSRRNSTASNRRYGGDDSSLHRRRTSESLQSADIASTLPENGTSQVDIVRAESLPRPASAQSLSRMPLDNASLHVRHRRAGSTSSARSRSSMLVSGSPVANYRRTPAVTQVRRVAMSSSMKRRPSHSRTHSNASSFRSGTSDDSGDDDVADIDEAIPEEEAEPDKPDTTTAPDTMAEREKTLEVLSSAQTRTAREQAVPPPNSVLSSDPHIAIKPAQAPDDTTPPAAARGHHSRASSVTDAHSHKNAMHGQSHHSHSRHQSLSALPGHAPAIFTAHKVVNPFGTPAGSHYTPAAAARRRTSSESAKPPLRDVFRTKKPADADNEWVDEEDEFSKYSGGFGQSQVWLNKRSHRLDSGVTAPASSPALCFGEKRYAALSAPRVEAAGSTNNQRKPNNGVQPSAFKRAAIVEEEEEEE